MTYWKAVRMDGLDWYSGTVRWLPPVGEPLPEGGLIVRHPTARKRTTGHAAHHLSVVADLKTSSGVYGSTALQLTEKEQHDPDYPD